MAVHQLSATTTSTSNLPGATELLFTGTTANTPLRFSAAAASWAAMVAPWAGALMMAPCSRPGISTSMPNKGLPRVIAAVSTPTLDWPMMVKREGSLSATLARSGAVSAAAPRAKLA